MTPSFNTLTRLREKNGGTYPAMGPPDQIDQHRLRALLGARYHTDIQPLVPGVLFRYMAQHFDINILNEYGRKYFLSPIVLLVPTCAIFEQRGLQIPRDEINHEVQPWCL